MAKLSTLNIRSGGSMIKTMEDMDTPVNNKIGIKYDTDKLRWDLLDVDFPEGIVKVLTFGAKKYDPNNWRKLVDNNGTERCYAAFMRHMVEWRKGNKVDPETGIPHIFHAACNLYFLQYYDGVNDGKSTE